MEERAKLHADLEALVGSVIHDRYRVESLLGAGGMGAVFRAHHLGLRRDVAFKVLHPEIGRDESISKRFDREAASASRLDHPNCVRVTDFGTTENGTKYLVMELLAGRELKDSLGTALPPARAVQIAIQIFQALEHAHHFGVVHRDLKPENVFLTTDFRGQEVVKLVDFGIAKLIDEQGAQEKLTRAGVVFGTPRYMSPEQAAGGKVDERSDLYTAGLILYEMLCGHVPFEADDLAQVLRMQIIAPPPALPPSVPLALVEIVENLLEKSKSDRRASAREVLDVLVPLERELTPSPPPPAALPMAPTFPEMPVAADVARGAPTFGSSAAAPTIPHIPLSRSGPTTSSLVVVPSRDDPRKRWRPWLIAAGAMFLVLMFIGAVVSSGEDDTGSNAAPGSFTTQPADEAREEEDDWEHEQNKKRKKKREKDREKEKKHWEIKWQ